MLMNKDIDPVVLYLLFKVKIKIMETIYCWE